MATSPEQIKANVERVIALRKMVKEELAKVAPKPNEGLPESKPEDKGKTPG